MKQKALEAILTTVLDIQNALADQLDQIDHDATLTPEQKLERLTGAVHEAQEKIRNANAAAPEGPSKAVEGFSHYLGDQLGLGRADLSDPE